MSNVLNYTGAQLNAMMVAMHGDGDGNFRVTEADGNLQFINATDGKYHTEWIETSNGKPKKKIQITGES
jgi:hypothetical protein